MGRDHLIVVLAIAIAIPFTMPLCSAPTADVAITFENPTEYPLDIEVTSDPDSGWTSAGFVPPRSTALAHVVDHGDDWLFRFASQGEDGGELQLTRRDLHASRWHIAIPVEVEMRLSDLLGAA